jgi:hypothetical protein
MNILRFLQHFTIVLIVIFLAVDGKRKSKGSKSRGGQKYSGKCKPKIMAEYELAFHGSWSEDLYPRMFPKYRPPAQWSKLIGKYYFMFFNLFIYFFIYFVFLKHF